MSPIFQGIFIIRLYFIALQFAQILNASTHPRKFSYAELSISQLSKLGIPTWLGLKEGKSNVSSL